MKSILCKTIMLFCLPVILIGAAPELKQKKEIPLKQKLEELTVIKDDFLVNDDVTGGCKQSLPSVGMSYEGKLIVAWEEDKRCGDNFEIYACKYSSIGTPITSIFRVNDDSGGRAQNAPCVATDSAGNFVIVWTDARNGQTDIYGQLYDNQAVKIGTNFVINDDGTGGMPQDEPAVSYLQDGKFVAVWADQRNSQAYGRDIYCQIFNHNGTKVGNNLLVNTDSQRVEQRTPHVSPDGPASFAIVWGDCRRNELDIYYQRFSLTGTPIGDNFKINEDTVKNLFGWTPYIASNKTTQTVVIWRDNRETYFTTVWGQLFNPATAQKIGTNFCINPGGKSSWQSLIKVASTGTDNKGNFYVAWLDTRRSQYAMDTYMQKHLQNGDTAGNIVVVNDNPTTDPYSYLLSPAPVINITRKDTGNPYAIVVWQDRPDTQDFDIMLQAYDSTNTPIGNNISLVPDSGTRPQIYPQIAMNQKGNFVIVWEDSREWGHCDIFAQTYDENGSPISDNIKINDDSSFENSAPTVAIDTNGAFVVVWKAMGCFLNGRKFELDGTSLTPTFRITYMPAGGGAATGETKIAMKENGDFITVWEDYRFDWKFPDIFAKKFSANCDSIDTTFKINDVGGVQSISPNISMKKNGEFVIVWQGEEYLQDMTHYDVFAQRYDSLSNPVGTNFIVNDDAAFLISQERPAVTLKENGEFIIVWEDYRNGNSDIYCQMFNPSGLPIGSNFKINKETDSSSQKYPAVIANNITGDFMVSWSTWKNVNSKIAAQMFDNSAYPVDSEFIIHLPEIHPANQRWVSRAKNIASNDDLIVFTWMDNRRIKGWDIYAKLMGKKPAVEENGNQTKITISPNPLFNQLIVKYIVKKTGKYSLSLYDRTGRRLAYQPQGEKSPGTYNAEIDINKFSAGVYFVKLESPVMEKTSIDKVVIFKDKK